MMNLSKVKSKTNKRFNNKTDCLMKYTRLIVKTVKIQIKLSKTSPDKSIVFKSYRLPLLYNRRIGLVLKIDLEIFKDR